MNNKALSSHELAKELLGLPNCLMVIKTRKKTRHYALIKGPVFREKLSLLVTENSGERLTEYTEKVLTSFVEIERAF